MKRPKGPDDPVYFLLRSPGTREFATVTDGSDKRALAMFRGTVGASIWARTTGMRLPVDVAQAPLSSIYAAAPGCDSLVVLNGQGQVLHRYELPQKPLTEPEPAEAQDAPPKKRRAKSATSS